MTENSTGPSNVMEYTEPRQPAIDGGSQAWEGIGSTNAKKIIKNIVYIHIRSIDIRFLCVYNT
jgi:hypothetical protein